MNQPTQTIVITGDITMDWNLARARRSKSDAPFWNADDTTSTTWQRGGAALLADLVEAIAQDLQRDGAPAFSILQAGTPRPSERVHPDDSRYHHSYAMWSLYKYGDKPAWRVEEFLGLNRAASREVQDWQKVSGDRSAAGLLILDDANQGFRDHPQLWPVALHNTGAERPWVLLKMAKPLAQGQLWQHLHDHFSDRLIVVAAVDDLRLSEVQISRELSWERTAQDIFWELVHNPCINGLSHCAHTVISFGPAGAILLSSKAVEDQLTFHCSLFFDPKSIERMWEKDYPGGMIGYTSCLAAGLARQWLLPADQRDIQQGIQSGLTAMRSLHLEGYGERGTSASQARLLFPVARIVSVLAKKSERFVVAAVQDPVRFIGQAGEQAGRPLTEGFWTILQDKFQDGLEQAAARVVREGPELILRDVPWGQFGKLQTVDRQEIESYRSIRNLVTEYYRQKPLTRPLSIAVFGTPGSGKSFGVTEMAKALLPGQIETITFNLSQFDTPEALLSAFHQVRDISLGGMLPLVFWDEFDTSLAGTPLGWLRYFLSPMQDGRFQEGQISHPLGGAIFVFAGGTSSSMAEFDRGTDPSFKAAKGPDFVSRLKGFINVLGPNPLRGAAADPYFILRRAILLRSSLKRGTPQLFENHADTELLNIDHGVLRALLKIGEYKHGARSIESILSMSQLTNKTAFERSCLPSESQLDLHVDGKKFLALVQQVELEGPMLEALAEAAHEVYREGMQARGYVYGPTKDDQKKTRPALVPYAKLPEHLKAANRLNVRDIPGKLAVAGFIMIPARSNEPPFNFPGAPLEILAEEEHERWMRALIGTGWACAPVTDESQKLHQCLLPWSDLPEEEKEKDRDLVRGIPRILARAGYAIMKANG